MADAATADLSSLAADLARASGTAMTQAAQQVIRQAALEVQAAAQAAAPVRTGALRQSISIGYPEPLTAVIGPHVDYGAYQEYGTGSRGEFPGSPYPIRPRRPGGVLAFKVNGRTVITRKVMHPGVRAKAYMRRGLAQAFGDRLVQRLADTGALLITKGPNA